MRPTYWFMVIALLVVLGCLLAAQRLSIFARAYEVGEQMGRLHAAESDVAWLATQVEALASPTYLSQIAKERNLQFVAWSTLPEVDTASQDDFIHVAAVTQGESDQ